MPIPPSGLDPESWLALDLIPGLGAESTRKLLSAFGAPGAVLSQSHQTLSKHIGSRVADAITTRHDNATFKKRFALSLDWLAGESNHLLTLADDDYPRALLEIVDPPAVLYLKGDRDLLGRCSRAIAIVGSRNATPGGVQNAEAFARALSEAGFAIVSGMALGIDSAAHRGGLAGHGSTIAVVGTGLDLVYPARNRDLARQISERGLIISEFSLGTPALANNFPRRNRIISGLSRGVLVVEAALESGSLITARQAVEQGRDVFAIPGSIHSPLSKGAHQLIKQGAKLVDDASDILAELGEMVLHSPPRNTSLPLREDLLLTAMGFDAVTVDELVVRCQFPPEQLSAQLLALEIEGYIAQMAGGKFQRLR